MSTNTFALALEAFALLSMTLCFLRYTQVPGSSHWTVWDFVGAVSLGMAILCLALLALTVLAMFGFM
jgi:hypothetical protein